MVYGSLRYRDYTWKNALLWGNFAEHCKRASKGSLGNRLVHALIASLELLPLVGQVASIFEKIIASRIHTQPLFYQGYRLNSLSNESPEIILMLTELCEKKGEIPCSHERFCEIVEILKAQNKLYLLNAVPSCFHRRLAWIHLPNEDSRTPLHYWAQKGNLVAVKILMEHGAQDNFQDNPTTGIFLAAFNGQSEVVEHLLSNGSRTDVAHDNVLNCFIPKLIYEMVSYNRFDDKALACLKMILQDLKSKNPQNLKFQFKIPIIEDDEYHLNILDWIQSDLNDHQTPKDKETISRLLKEFGAKPFEVFSRNDLEAQLYDIENRSTLSSGICGEK